MTYADAQTARQMSDLELAAARRRAAEQFRSLNSDEWLKNSRATQEITKYRAVLDNEARRRYHDARAKYFASKETR